MEWITEHWGWFGGIAIALLGVGLSDPAARRWFGLSRPDLTKKKFVATAAGCMGCLTVASVVLGLIAAVLSLIGSVRQIMQ